MPNSALEDLRDLRLRHDRELRSLIGAALEEGASSQDVARALGLSRATLWRRYGEQLRRRSDHV